MLRPENIYLSPWENNVVSLNYSIRGSIYRKYVLNPPFYAARIGSSPDDWFLDKIVLYSDRNPIRTNNYLSIDEMKIKLDEWLINQGCILCTTEQVEKIRLIL